MKSKKKIIIISAVGVAVLTVVMVLTLVCFHSWTDATCDTPMTCKNAAKQKVKHYHMNGLRQPAKKQSIVHGVGLPTANRLHTALTKRLANCRKPVRSAALQRGSLSVINGTKQIVYLQKLVWFAV